jgi:hypothetical protein
MKATTRAKRRTMATAVKLVYESLYYERKAPHRKRLFLPVTETLSTGVEITIPKGFVTDLATVPRIFWGIISPSGRHDLACVVHDYLLDSGYNRKQADKELLHFLKKSKVHRFKSYLMYALVRGYAILKSYAL